MPASSAAWTTRRGRGVETTAEVVAAEPDHRDLERADASRFHELYLSLHPPGGHSANRGAHDRWIFPARPRSPGSTLVALDRAVRWPGSGDDAIAINPAHQRHIK